MLVITVLIGGVAAALGNWWTFGGMVLVVVGQLLAERARRRALETETSVAGVAAS